MIGHVAEVGNNRSLNWAATCKMSSSDGGVRSPSISVVSVVVDTQPFASVVVVTFFIVFLPLQMVVVVLTVLLAPPQAAGVGAGAGAALENCEKFC